MAIYKRLRLLECAGGAQAHKLGTCTLQLPHPKDQYKIEPIGASCWATLTLTLNAARCHAWV